MSAPAAERPGWFEFELVRSCDYRCLHCDAWRRRDADDALTFDAWLDLAAQAAALAPGAPLGVTTGEPFLHPRLLEFVGRAVRLGLDPYLNTHGGLIDEAAAERVVASGLRALWLSLDGLEPATHDFGRGTPGAHGRALAALERLARAGFRRAGLVTIVMAHNLAELPALARWAGEKGLRGIMFQPLQPYGPDWRRCVPDPAAARRALEAVEDARRAGAPVLNPPEQLEAMARSYEKPDEAFPRFDCRASRTLIVENDGVARVCRYWSEAGHAPAASLAAIWEGAAARGLRARAAACHRSCVLMGCHFPFPASSFL